MFDSWSVTNWLVTIFIGIICYQVIVLIFQQHRQAQHGAKKDKHSRRRTGKQAERGASSVYKEILKLYGDSQRQQEEAIDFDIIGDKFENLTDVSRAIKEAGLESSNIIIGVDFTASNEWQGRKSFEHRSLHYISSKNSKRLNPYQKVISSMAETLEHFDDDHLIPCYGFGDKSTKDVSVFPFCEYEKPCVGFRDVLDKYCEVVQKTELSGPTNFAPIINKAIEIVRKKKSYHILIIIADGQVVEEQEEATRDAIAEASSYPLSIILVGVGDGPWDVMEEYDEKLPRRKFDNFQFVDYTSVIKKSKKPDSTFVLNALMEIPDQYKAIKKLGYLDSHNSIQSENQRDNFSIPK